MKDKQDTDSNSIPEQGAAFASRRRIIKGLASSVPVVMTIGCGQAMANASSLQCVAELRKERPTECIDVDPSNTTAPMNPDGWFRKTIDVRKKATDPKELKSCLVIVDQDGILDATTGKRGPVTLSCYASFMPG